MLLATLPDLFAEQGYLPGMEDLIPILLSVPSEPVPPIFESLDTNPATSGGAHALTEVSRDQLTLGADQGVLRELDAVPRQLALIPDPPPWQADHTEPGIQPRSSRMSRRRHKLGISPGQSSLF